MNAAARAGDGSFDAALVPHRASIRSAMAAIDASGLEIALLVDGRGRLEATVSDGDIRRALLRGAALDDPVAPAATRTFTAVTAPADRAAVLDLMQARHISQVPVLDADGVVVGLHLLREFVTAEPIEVAAVLMAGGKGTRLRPLTDTIPKPMLPVAGRPILERLVLHLVGAGVRDLYLSVNYRAEVIVEHFGDGSRFGCRISYLHEEADRPLGTGGALALLPAAERRRGRPILVMNGDLVTSFDVAALLDAHRDASAVATIGAREHVTDIPFGVLEEEGGYLRALAEKPRLSHLVNAGVYVLEPAVLTDVPPGIEYPITELLAALVRAGLPVWTHRLDGDWVDVGRPAQLRQARGEEAA